MAYAIIYIADQDRVGSFLPLLRQGLPTPVEWDQPLSYTGVGDKGRSLIGGTTLARARDTSVSPAEAGYEVV